MFLGPGSIYSGIYTLLPRTGSRQGRSLFGVSTTNGPIVEASHTYARFSCADPSQHFGVASKAFFTAAVQ